MEAMAIIAIVSAFINYFVTSARQDDEFFNQQQLLGQQQDFQSEREEWYFEHNNIGAQFQQMLGAGFNPNLAANSLLGGTDVSAAQSGSSPTAPTVNSAIGALQNMFGQGGQNLYDLWQKQASIENTQANTNKTNVEAGIMPRDFELRSLSTIEQLRVWNASVERTKAAQHLDEEQTKLIANQNMYYGRMAQAQIDTYNATVLEKYSNALRQLEAINTEKSEQAVNYSQVGVNVEQAAELRQRTILESEESSKTYYEAQRERIAKEFEESLGGIPLTADAQKYVQGLVKKGDIDGIKNFYLSIFATSQNQELGKLQGTPTLEFGLPFDIWKGRFLPGQRGYGNNESYWNPPMTYPN